jgi:TPR repeat protein
MNRAVPVACCLTVVAALAPISVAKSVPLEPPDPGRGIIGITVKVVPPARMGSNVANAVFFVRVAEDADRFAAESLIASTYAKGENVYLLNAKPGRYVAVGCTFNAAVGLGFAGATSDGAVAFSQPDIVKTEVEVRAGAVVFMGRIDVQSSTKIQKADGAQSHYLRMIAPTGASQSFMARAMTGHLVYIASFKEIDRGPSAAAVLWNEAIEHDFKNDAAWTNRIARRSVEPMGVAPGAIAAGATPSSDAFVSGVCITVNTAKARAAGSPKEADTIAAMACQTVMTDWSSHGCGSNPDQDPCKKRLRSLDGSLRSAGSSMLYAAAQAGQTAICKTMIAVGSDPNAAIATSWTSLMIAAAEDRPEVVKLLLDSGANRDATNAEGKTAATIAAERSSPEIVAMLTKAAPATPPQGDASASELEQARSALKAGDYATALRIVTPAAQGGDAAAQNLLGVMYLEGWGVEHDSARALPLFRSSAEHGDAKAAYNLGRMYDNGWAVRKDFAEAVKWYRMSAEKGYALGQSSLGAMYATGDGAPQDYPEAMKWYRLAADQGEPEAQRRVGLMYAEGQGVGKDDAEAFTWYLKAAQQGSIPGEYWVGRFYLEGRGVEKNLELAKEWLGKAAENGSDEAKLLYSTNFR